MAERATPFDCALRILGLRDHSEAELTRKLASRGYEPQEIQATVARLKELNYLDDLRFARGFAESSLRNGRRVGVSLRLELSRRGIPAGVAGEVLEELSGEYDEGELLTDTLRRRFAGFDPAGATDKEKRRVVAYLQRKGFSLSAILKQLKTYPID